MSGQGSGGNVLAAICNVFLAGLGQLVQGRFWLALLFFALVYLGYAFYFLIVPGVLGFIFHIWAIIDAARYKPSGG